MRTRWLQVCGWFLAVVGPLGADMLESAGRARDLLGPERWAQVLRIERTGAGLARIVRYALVFELEDRLWFYAEDEGTQSLSTHRGRLARDKADLGPLLKQVDPRFVRYEVVSEDIVHTGGRGAGALPQGCFIECVAYLRSMNEAGRTPGDVRLLAYYGQAAAGTRGHTILCFTEYGRRFYYDPEASPALVAVPGQIPPEPLALARLAAPVGGYARPARAVFLPLHSPAPEAADWSGRALAAGGASHREATDPVLMP